MIALAPMLGEERDLQVMARQRLVQDHVLHRAALQVFRHVAVVVDRRAGCRRPLPAVLAARR